MMHLECTLRVLTDAVHSVCWEELESQSVNSLQSSKRSILVSYNFICFCLPGGFTCYCEPGYHGEVCEFEINECGSNPCRNGAACIDYINGYNCSCSPGKVSILTLNCIRYPALPLVHNGGSMEPPQRKPLSNRIFLIIFTPYVYTLITTIFQEKKYKIFAPFQNGGKITDFHFASFRFRPKFEKPLSQRNFSMKFGLN